MLEALGNNDAARTIIGFVSQLSAQQMTLLANNNKWDIIAKGIGTSGWELTNLKRYASEVQGTLANGSQEVLDTLSRFERFADVKNSKNLLQSGLQTSEVDGLLKAAENAANSGDNVLGFVRDLATGDIDIETVTRVAEVKSGNAIINERSSDIKRWAQYLQDEASRTGKSPALYVPQDKVQNAITKLQKLNISTIDVIGY